MVPQAEPLQPLPLTPHVTDVFVALVTVAVNCCVDPTTTRAVGGETETATGATTVTEAVADFVGSAADVAVTNTWGGEGTLAGAE